MDLIKKNDLQVSMQASGLQFQQRYMDFGFNFLLLWLYWCCIVLTEYKLENWFICVLIFGWFFIIIHEWVWFIVKYYLIRLLRNVKYLYRHNHKSIMFRHTYNNVKNKKDNMIGLIYFSINFLIDVSVPKHLLFEFMPK
jgi:hypothetical protein